tara:strand:- start:1156 stop:1458 length:303 start_codon:yes stop_codon:yes gene_type:complete
MPMPAALMSSMSSGHDCFPPQNAIGPGSMNVFINGQPVLRIGDGFNVHCCPDKGCHPGFLAKGSMNVFANGMPVSRVGDTIACGPGNVVITGSLNVFVGG